MNSGARIHFLLIFFLASLGCAGESLRIATWNARNYLSMNRWHDGKFRMDYPKPEAEKACMRDLLIELRPDVLLLQETGGEPFVRELRDDLRALGLNYPHLHTGLADGSERALALLSRVAPIEVVFHDPVAAPRAQNSEAVMRRGIQEVLLRVGEARLRLFHVHIKSRWSDDPLQPDAAEQRGAEIAALARIAGMRTSLGIPDEVTIVLGDFNSPPGDPVLEPLLDGGWQRLSMVDSTGQDWTYFHHRSQSTDAIDAVYVRPGRWEYFAPEGLYPERIEDLCASDHRLLLFTFEPPDGHP